MLFSHLYLLVKEWLQLRTAGDPPCTPVSLAERKTPFRPWLQQVTLILKLVPPRGPCASTFITSILHVIVPLKTIFITELKNPKGRRPEPGPMSRRHIPGHMEHVPDSMCLNVSKLISNLELLEIFRLTCSLNNNNSQYLLNAFHEPWTYYLI